MNNSWGRDLDYKCVERSKRLHEQILKVKHIEPLLDEVMEPKRTGGNVEEGANSFSDDESRSSSASTASVASAMSVELVSEDPDGIDGNEHGNIAYDHKQSEKGLAKQGSSTSPKLESPPVQVMERPPNASMYRIPSRVFSTNKSTPQLEWSLASNDSLFSIQNMSFTREEFNMLLKSGELGVYADMLKSGELGSIAEICKSGELPLPLKDALISWKEQMPTKHPDNNRRMSREQLTSSGAAAANVGVKRDEPISQVIDTKGTERTMDEPPCPATVSRETETLAPSFASHVVPKSERSSTASSRPSGVDKPKETGDALGSQMQEQTNESDTPPPQRSSCFSCFSCC